jgi:hypothetical protein
MSEMDETVEVGAMSVARLGDSLWGVIGQRLGEYLVDGSSVEGLAKLDANLLDIKGIEIPDQELVAYLTDRAHTLTLAEQQKRMVTHMHMLRCGRILLANPEDEDDKLSWHTIPLVENARYKQPLTDISKSIDSTEPKSYELTQGEVDKTIGTLTRHIDDLAREIGSILEMHMQQGFNRTFSLARLLLKLFFASHSESKNGQIFIDQDGDEYTALIQKISELNKILDDLINTPARLLGDMIIDDCASNIITGASEALDGSVATSNAQIYGQSPGVSGMQVVQPSKGKPKKRQSKSTPDREKFYINDHPEEAAGKTEELESVGYYRLKMPWINERSPVSVQVQQLESAGGMVYIVRGVHPNLEKIAQDCRKKFPKTADDLSEFDRLARHIARYLANGQYPATNPNIAKRLDTAVNVSYQPLVIWYAGKVKNNASRLYFSYVTMRDLVVSEETDLNTTAVCLIVLAETDKNNQIQVLNALSRVSASENRSRIR